MLPIREAAPMLDLPPDVDEQLTVIEEAPEPDRKRQAAQYVGDFLTDTASGTLGGLLGSGLLAAFGLG